MNVVLDASDGEGPYPVLPGDAAHKGPDAVIPLAT
jgi:hypothetical protein